MMADAEPRSQVEVRDCDIDNLGRSRRLVWFLAVVVGLLALEKACEVLWGSWHLRSQPFRMEYAGLQILLSLIEALAYGMLCRCLASYAREIRIVRQRKNVHGIILILGSIWRYIAIAVGAHVAHLVAASAYLTWPIAK